MSVKEQVVGNWKFISLTRQGIVHAPKCKMKVIIRSNGTYDIVLHTAGREVCISGIYKIFGNKLKRFFEEELELDTCTFDVCDQQMVLCFSEDEIFTFRKLGGSSLRYVCSGPSNNSTVSLLSNGITATDTSK